MTAHILTPYPGRVLYERLHSENRIIDEDYPITTRRMSSTARFVSRRLARGIAT